MWNLNTMVWAKFVSRAATVYFKVYVTCRTSKDMLFGKIRAFNSSSYISIIYRRFVWKVIYILRKRIKKCAKYGHTIPGMEFIYIIHWKYAKIIKVGETFRSSQPRLPKIFSLFRFFVVKLKLSRKSSNILLPYVILPYGL